MIFTIGFILFLGCYIAALLNDVYYWCWHNWIIKSLGALVVIGFLLMLYSILNLTWQYLP